MGNEIWQVYELNWGATTHLQSVSSDGDFLSHIWLMHLGVRMMFSQKLSGLGVRNHAFDNINHQWSEASDSQIWLYCLQELLTVLIHPFMRVCQADC